MAGNESGISRNIRVIVEKLEDTLKITCDQLTGELPTREINDFNSDIFWTNFTSATQLVSHEATKFCMAFNSGGMSSTVECQSLIDKVENACLALLSVFFKLPKTRGKLLYKEISTQVLNILQRMKQLCFAIKTQSVNRLQVMGDVWAHCEAVERLPKDNREAVLELCQQQYDMVTDALLELNAAMEDESGPEFELSIPMPPNGMHIPPVQRWDTSDRSVLFPCSGLLKAVKACIKKTRKAISERGNGNDEGCCAELDLLADIVKTSSCTADDFVLSVYPPMDHSLVSQQATLIRDNAKELLSCIKNSHFCAATDEVWIDFLDKALDHNWTRINNTAVVD